LANVLDVGRLGYLEAWDLQKRIASQVQAGVLDDTLMFVEHPAVLTLGANFHEENLLLTREEYAERGIEVERTDRGGDVTFHGPDQLVIYPIFDLKRYGKDLHKWLRDLEETVIVAIRAYGLEGYRFPPNTGTWVNGRKIAAIGIKVSKWVSIHGIALNCSNDLEPFEAIVPCGITDYGVTSISEEAGRKITIEDAKPQVIAGFETVFGIRLTPISLDALHEIA